MTKTNKYIIFIILYFLQNFIVWGQNPYYNKIDKSNGLPSNTIYDITQDQKGFMWFVTNEGVCKYDGLTFTPLSTKKVTSKAGSSLVVAPDNTIYYCNFDGYIYYNKKETLEPLPQNQPLGYNPIGILGKYLLTTEKNNIVIFNTYTHKPIKKIPFNHNTFVTSTLGNKCYYILSDCLYKINDNLSVEKITLPDELKNNSEAKLLKYGDGKLFFFNKYSIKYYVLSENKFLKFELPIGENIIQNIAFVDHKIWLCTTNGIYKLAVNNQVEHLFKNHNISYFFKDSFENYWITTLTEGLILIPNFNTKLYPFPETITQFDTLKNQLILGTVNNSVFHYDLEKNNPKKIVTSTDNHEIYLLKRINDYLFVTSSQFRIYNRNNLLLVEKKLAVKNIVAIDSKYFAVAASGFCGIFCFDHHLKSEWDEFYKKGIPQREVLNEVRIESNIKAKSIAYNPYNKTIYISTNLGVITQTITKKKQLKYQNKPLYINNLYNHKNVIYGINANGSLIKINPDNTIQTLKLTNEEINKIKIINDILYLFTKKNILQYHLIKKTKTIILTNNQEFDVSDIEQLNQQILFATKKGIIAKNLSDLNIEHDQKFVLNHITINEKTYLQIPNTLDYNQNNIKFNFSILNYNINHSNPISYKINNNKWYTLENLSRNLIINELAPGKYTIQFCVFNPHNKKNDYLTYSFEIKQPFWKTIGFLALSLGLLFLLTYFFITNHIKKINSRNKEKLEKINLENELNKSRLTAIKSQMNPHFFFNALNTIQSYILTNDNKKALFYLKKFSVLTRNILETSEKEFISLKDEIKTLELYLEIEKARFNENDFNYEINTRIHHLDTIKVPAMLIQPYVENAVKHGLLHKTGIKKLSIDMQIDDSYLKINIEDNGIGRKKSEALNRLKKGKHNSFATQALTNRISILNKNKKEKISIQFTDKDESKNDETGTIVTILIPLNIYDCNNY